MPTFILSLNWTDQGIRGVKENSHIVGGICNAEYDSASLRGVFELWVERHPDHL